jgi:hypothetical protein
MQLRIMGYMASMDGCDWLELVILAGKWIIERMQLSLPINWISLPIIWVFVSLHSRNNGEYRSIQ